MVPGTSLRRNKKFRFFYFFITVKLLFRSNKSPISTVVAKNVKKKSLLTKK